MTSYRDQYRCGKPTQKGTPCTRTTHSWTVDDFNAAVKYHTEPFNCGQSCRCNGRPNCYPCGGSFCMCSH